jgi:phosphatidylglycerophosphate synthase
LTERPRTALEDLRAAGFAPSALAPFLVRVVRDALPAAVEPASRRRAFWRALAVTYASLVALYVPAVRFLPVGAAVQLCAVLAVWLVALGALCYLALPLVRHPDGTPLTKYTVANALTLWRLGSVPLIVGLILHARSLAPIGPFAFAFYVTSVTTDIADGLIARASKTETDFGRAVDPLADVLVQLAVVWALAASRAVPWWLVVAVTLRYTVAPVGALGILLLRGPFRVYPTTLGKVSGLCVSFTASWIVLRETVGPAWTYGPWFAWVVIGCAVVCAAQSAELIYLGVQEMRGKGTAPPPRPKTR